MSIHRVEGANSVDVVIVSSCGMEWPRGFPVQHGRDDGDVTSGVIYRDRPPIQWKCRQVEVDGGSAFVCETSGAWGLHESTLDEVTQ
jgi:hypothetical protein